MLLNLGLPSLSGHHHTVRVMLVPKITIVMSASYLGNLVYCTLFGRHILVIQTTDVAKALLEQRSTVYSDRPPVKVHEEYVYLSRVSIVSPKSLLSIGSEFNSALLQYGEKWRLHRRLFHQSFRAEAARDYLPTQLRKARQLLIGVYNSPDRYQRQIEL